MDDFAFGHVTWQDVEKAATDGILACNINPSEQAQALARHVAAKAYEAAITAAQADIAFARTEMESFEDFFSGLAEIMEARLTATRRLYDRN